MAPDTRASQLHTPDRTALQEYVCAHLDEAIAKGWIRLYFQPIVRSLSYTLCGFEALARWQDPVHRLISPGIFIPALEKAGSVHKLDLCMVDQICFHYHPRADEGMAMVPVSFNLSRLDFFACNLFEEINGRVDRAGIPHSQLALEITESVFVQDMSSIAPVLDQFRSAGYEIWMDDFGSGFSSLNVLKDYGFDTIKLDMAFLDSFTDRARTVVKNVVRMAKELDIFTLAEGVETPDQAEFLRSIGCDRLQGFLFSRPLEVVDSRWVAEEVGLFHETDAMRRYFDDADRVNLITDSPLALVEFKTDQAGGHQFRFYFANSAYQKVTQSMGFPNPEAVAEDMSRPDSFLWKTLAPCIHQAAEPGQKGSVTFQSQGQFFWLQIHLIAQANDYYLYKCRLQNITTTMDRLQETKLQGLQDRVYDLYNTVTLLDMEKKEARPLAFWYKNSPFQPGRTFDSPKAWDYYISNFIHPDDQDRFREFSNVNTLEKRCDPKDGILADYFRSRMPDGIYQWNMHGMILLPERFGRKALHVARICRYGDATTARQLIRVYEEYFGK